MNLRNAVSTDAALSVLADSASTNASVASHLRSTSVRTIGKADLRSVGGQQSETKRAARLQQPWPRLSRRSQKNNACEC
jgi:hypothetical protein